MTDARLRRVATIVLAVSVAGYLVGVGFRVFDTTRHVHGPQSVWSSGSELMDLLQYASFATFTLVGGMIAIRRPRNTIGWIFLAIGLCWALDGFLTGYYTYGLATHPGSLPGAAVAGGLDGGLWVPAVGLLGTFALLLFPDGHLPSPGWRWVAWVTAIVLALAYVVVTFDPSPMDLGAAIPKIPNPLGIRAIQPLVSQLQALIILIPLCIGACAWSLIRRFRRSHGVEHLQLKWLAAAAATVAGIYLIVEPASMPYAWSSGSNAPAWVEAGQSIAALSFCLIPIAAGIAVLRHKLYDIDVVIRRSLVYASLAAFITGVYVAIVVGIGRVIGARGGPNIGLSIAATAVVAVAFQPVRERVQHFANRLVYGKRATPYEVMSGFAARIGGALSVDEALPRMAEAAALGVGATAAAVRVRLHDGSVQSVAWPTDATVPAPFDHVEHVRFGDEEVGDISVAKPRGEALTPSEVKLLDDLGAQAGLAMHNVRLALELRSRVEEISRQAGEISASRQRIVAAQDDARRGLQRRIQDGPERQLASIERGLEDAESLVTSEPARGQALLDQLAAKTTSALDALRELARGIYPPLLADKGLTAALSAQAVKSAVPVTVDADGVGRLAPALEAAVYFCCLEALQNVAAHAGARRTEIVLRRDERDLMFSVVDDGRGFDPTAPGASPGLQRMADRLAALGGALVVESTPGGGSKVSGRLPVGSEAPLQPADAAADHAASSRSGPNTDFGM